VADRVFHQLAKQTFQNVCHIFIGQQSENVPKGLISLVILQMSTYEQSKSVY